MTHSLDMDGYTPAMTSFTTAPPAQSGEYQPISCASGLIGCAALRDADNVVTPALRTFTINANQGFTWLQEAARNSGHHYLEGGRQAKDAVAAPQAPVAIQGVVDPVKFDYFAGGDA